MDPLIPSLILYAACALGAVGVALSLPRKAYSLRAIGGALAAAAAGVVLLFLSLAAAERTPGEIPNIYFYGFALIALAAALRMITHARPVYSALYFILTIIATSGLFVLLSAEFMAFALIIIYAGAILITYLFVIMLATQAPKEGDTDMLAEYDTEAREPWVASVAGFMLLALLTTVMFAGTSALPEPGAQAATGGTLDELPRKVERHLRRADLLAQGESVTSIDEATRTIIIQDADLQSRTLAADAWPAGLTSTNVESLGINLLRDHPMTIEIAGVILLMAMLGATVLARKHVELEELLKATEVRRLHDANTLRMEGQS
ncbi:MAG: hypothetical protein DHS20C14_05850 [Phycisphaeraceae bacterium]|nr:MAG: hypothetical protein DHS20C14_05850 [Phycisphaeraceae bacterium]